MFPAQKAVCRLAVSPHSIFVFHVEYHRFTAASLVPSTPDIVHEQSINVADRLVPRHHNSHALCPGSLTYTELTAAQPDQLAEVKSLAAEAWTVKVVTQDLLVPQLGDLLRTSNGFNSGGGVYKGAARSICNHIVYEVVTPFVYKARVISKTLSIALCPLVKAMLHEAIFLATCLATNVARQVARKISRVTPPATATKCCVASCKKSRKYPQLFAMLRDKLLRVTCPSQPATQFCENLAIKARLLLAGDFKQAEKEL